MAIEECIIWIYKYLGIELFSYRNIKERGQITHNGPYTHQAVYEILYGGMRNEIKRKGKKISTGSR